MDATIVESISSDFPAILRNSHHSRIWAIGDLKILDRPLLSFFCSKRCPGEAILRTYDIARHLRDSGVPVIGGFHSPMEKECLELLLRGSQPVVVCPARSIERMRVPSAWRKAIGENRLLVLSPFERAHHRPTGELADERNRFVALLASEVFVVFADEGSQTERLGKDLLGMGRSVLLLQNTANQELITLGAKPVSIETLVSRAARAAVHDGS
jgi:predicted Rossmann fold nucleotide-binding protein DprA/Smf involved in DNA uptake